MFSILFFFSFSMFDWWCEHERKAAHERRNRRKNGPLIKKKKKKEREKRKKQLNDAFRQKWNDWIIRFAAKRGKKKKEKKRKKMTLKSRQDKLLAIHLWEKRISKRIGASRELFGVDKLQKKKTSFAAINAPVGWVMCSNYSCPSSSLILLPQWKEPQPLKPISSGLPNYFFCN